MDPLTSADMLCIMSHRFPELVEASKKAIADMIEFNRFVLGLMMHILYCV